MYLGTSRAHWQLLQSSPCLQVLAWPAAFVQQDGVVAALQGLFQQLASHLTAAAGGHGSGGGVADPTQLRIALAAVPGSTFGQGELMLRRGGLEQS